MKRQHSQIGVGEEEAAYGGSGGDIVLYQAPDGTLSLQVRLEQETVWLTAHQMAALFGRDRTVIVRHIHNVFATGELSRESTCAKNAQVAADGRVRQMDLYNLDMILSVGYRVNSKRGTQFRIWATSVLREHILQGYTRNERRLQELNQAVRLVAAVTERRPLTGDEATALLRVIADYSYALDLLDDYDHQRVPTPKSAAAAAVPVSYEEAMRVVDRLRGQFQAGDLFGREKDDSLRSSLAAVHQTAGGRDAYPALEDKAVHLLYFLVKNHPFVDGNKRIAAALFLWFLEKNGALYRPDGGKRLADSALVAVTLLIAESRPADKDTLTRVVLNLIHRESQA